jgi:hypothetical protein
MIEIEYKYQTSINPQQFVQALKKISLRTHLKFKLKKTNKHDFYFIKVSSPDEYIRARETKKGYQLTIKQKIDGKSNLARKEENVFLSKDMNLENVSQWVSLMGYELNFEILKKSVVADFPEVEVAYYEVFQKNKKVEAFIELEYKGKIKAIDLVEKQLVAYEHLFQELNLVGNKVSFNNFERYKKPLTKNKK